MERSTKTKKLIRKRRTVEDFYSMLRRQNQGFSDLIEYIQKNPQLKLEMEEGLQLWQKYQDPVHWEIQPIQYNITVPGRKGENESVHAWLNRVFVGNDAALFTGILTGLRADSIPEKLWEAYRSEKKTDVTITSSVSVPKFRKIST